MTFHGRLLLLLLLLLPPCVCLLTNSTARIVAKLSILDSGDCDVSYCSLHNISSECNKALVKNSTCFLLNCPDDASCSPLLTNLASENASQMDAARPFLSSTATPPPAPDGRQPSKDHRPSSSSDMASPSLPDSHPDGSPNTTVHSKVSSVPPTVRAVTVPETSPRPETSSLAANGVQPDAAASQVTPSGEENGNKTDHLSEIPPRAPTTSVAMTISSSTMATTATTNATTAISTSTMATTATTNATTAISSSTMATTATTNATTAISTSTMATTATTNATTAVTTVPSTAVQTTVKITPLVMTEIASVPNPTAPSTTTAPSFPPARPVTPVGQNPSQTAPSAGQVPVVEGKQKDRTGEPLTIHVVNTSSLLAVLMFGLLFFVVTVVLFLRHAYESYKRKDYTQVDYLINGMYSDSGV